MKKSTSAVKAQSRRSADSTKTRPHKQPEKIGVCVVCGSWAPCKCPKPEDPSTWPVLWRVVAPTAGSFNHDMVFTETEDEQEAEKSLRALRRQGWPVRLERVACGSLPPKAVTSIVLLRSTNAQNPGGVPRPILGVWEPLS